MQLTALICGAIDWSVLYCRLVQGSVQCSVEHCIAMQSSAVHCSAVQYSAVQYSAVQRAWLLAPTPRTEAWQKLIDHLLVVYSALFPSV